ncbi:hypothetical protein Tco_0138977 [Tanacetum coccineum]
MTLYSTPPSLLYPKNPLSSNTHFIHKNTRPSLSIKASSSSSSKSLNNNNTTTLSSNWDVVGPTSAAPAWMPRFEELDTTNNASSCQRMFLISLNNNNGVEEKREIRKQNVDEEAYRMRRFEADRDYVLVLKNLGYESDEEVIFHYKILLKSLDTRLKPLISESNIGSMLGYVHKHKIMYVYVEHVQNTEGTSNDDGEGDTENETEFEDE